MEYNISDLEKLLNIHNEHEFITINIQRSQELLDVFTEYYKEYTEIIDFLKRDIKLFSEWEQEFYKDSKCNITYISLDNYEHSSDISKSYTNLKKYVEMYTIGTDILIKFYQGLKQIDVTYDIQCYINTLDDEYKDLFKPIIEKTKETTIIDNPIAETNTPANLLPDGQLLTNIDSENNTLNSPVKPNTEEPVKPVIEEPVKPTVEEPVKPTVEEPVKPVVEEPVKPVVEEPVKPAVEEPVKPIVDVNNTNLENSNHSSINTIDSSESNPLIILDDDDKTKKETGTPEPDDDFNHLLILDEGINNSVTDPFFIKIENIMSNMSKIKSSYIVLKENKNSINICRNALNTIIEYGLNVDTALTQLDTQDNAINNIITKFGNSLENINNTISKTNTDILSEVNKTKFKKQIKDITIK